MLDFSFLEEIRSLHPWFSGVWAFILGSFIGSFLNVCILRIPVGRSIVRPGSTCACGTATPFYRNIPIISWLWLRGRASCCGAKLSIQYPAVELITAVAFCLIWSFWSMQLPWVFAGWVLFSFLLVGTWIDWDYLILPDGTTLGLVFAGLILSFFIPQLHGITPEHWVLDGVRGVVHAMVAVVIASGTILWVALFGEYFLKKEAVGFGDIKLIGGVSAIIGWQGGVFALFGGAIIGVFFFLFAFPFWRWWSKKFPDRPLVGRKMRPEDYPEDSTEEVGLDTGKMIPFGPLLAAGALVYFFFVRTVVDDYLANVGRMMFP